jgi:hypothetical protein
MPQIADTSVEALLQRVQFVFPDFPMPPLDEMMSFTGGDVLCANFIEELDQYRFKAVDDALIRSSRLELYCLCPDAFKWILPHYIRYCLTAEILHTEDLVEFLVYFFKPAPEFLEDRLKRISALSIDQLTCVRDFFKWQVSSRYLYGANPSWSAESLESWFEERFKEMAQAADFCDKAIKILDTYRQT